MRNMEYEYGTHCHRGVLSLFRFIGSLSNKLGLSKLRVMRLTIIGSIHIYLPWTLNLTFLSSQVDP